MANGIGRQKHSRGHLQRTKKHQEPVEVFVLTSGTQTTSLPDEDFTEELCSALEETGCCVRLISTTRGWFKSMRMAFWVAKRSSAARLVLVDTHPVALIVLRCLAAPRLAYVQRSSHLYRLPVPKCIHQVLLRLADDVIVQSRASADLYQTMFCNCKVPKVLYPCIDIGSMAVDETLTIDKVLPNLSKNTNMYLSYGIFKPETNFDLIIDAFEIFYTRVRKRYRGEKVKLILAGNLNVKDYSQRKYYSYLLERLKEKRYAKDVYIVTKLSERGKKSLLAYSICAVFTYNSTRCLLEALFVGRPVLATMNAASKEILPRRAGFILPPSAKEFAKGLLFLFGDPQLAERMGHNAKVYYAQHFSFGKFARKIQSFVEGNVFQCQKCLEFYTMQKQSSTCATSELNSCSFCT